MLGALATPRNRYARDEKAGGTSQLQLHGPDRSMTNAWQLNPRGVNIPPALGASSRHACRRLATGGGLSLRGRGGAGHKAAITITISSCHGRLAFIKRAISSTTGPAVAAPLAREQLMPRTLRKHQTSPSTSPSTSCESNACRTFFPQDRTMHRIKAPALSTECGQNSTRRPLFPCPNRYPESTRSLPGVHLESSHAGRAENSESSAFPRTSTKHLRIHTLGISPES